MEDIAINRDERVVVAFDLDGVLVNNVTFEYAVTNYIIQKLSLTKNISFEEAQKEWNRVLKVHHPHPRWHDYSLHCDLLDLGDIWKEAHIKKSSLLKKYDRIDDAISIARNRCNCWIITDATEWVANFKLSCIGHSSTFSEIFSSSRCGYSKSFDDFWHSIAHSLPSRPMPLIFIENQLDNLHMAKKYITGCIPIWLDTPDHPQEIGFRDIEANTYRKQDIRVSTHDELPEKLIKIINDCYLPT